MMGAITPRGESRLQRSKAVVGLGWAGVLMLGVAGCAPMSVGAPVVTDMPRGTEERSRLNGVTEGVVGQDGSRVSVHLTDHCDVQRFDQIERTTIREHHNDASQNDWYAGIAGALAAGAGAVAIASPASVQPADGSRSVQEVRGGGYALVGLGVALLAVPVIDYVRVHREVEHKVERVVEPGPVLRRNQPCTPPASGTEVLARYPDGRVLSLGRTDANGNAVANLDETTPADCFFSRDARVVLSSAGNELGTISLSALYDEREAAAWQRAQLNDCSTSVAEGACDEQAAYVRRYSEGPHAVEARAAVVAAADRRAIALDDAAWAGIDPSACTSLAKRDVVAIEASCAPLEQYVRAYPLGRHAEAARATLLPAKQLVAQLEQQEANREAARVAVGSAGNYIPYAGNGGGPTLCADGMISNSSGRGTCSHHGGVAGGSSRSSGGGNRHSSGGGRRSGGRRK